MPSQHDEFVDAVRHLEHCDDAGMVAGRIRSALTGSARLDGHTTDTVAVIGVVVENGARTADHGPPVEMPGKWPIAVGKTRLAAGGLRAPTTIAR